MSLIRWDPLDDLTSLREALNKVFDETFARRGIGRFDGGRGWQPSVDMFETESDIVIRADLPGIDQKDLEVTLTDSSLTIKGESRHEKEIEGKDLYRRERAFGRFARTLPITTKIVPEEARSSFKNGVLEVVIPKAEEAKKRTYRLDIH